MLVNYQIDTKTILHQEKNSTVLWNHEKFTKSVEMDEMSTRNLIFLSIVLGDKFCNPRIMLNLPHCHIIKTAPQSVNTIQNAFDESKEAKNTEAITPSIWGCNYIKQTRHELTLIEETSSSKWPWSQVQHSCHFHVSHWCKIKVLGVQQDSSQLQGNEIFQKSRPYSHLKFWTTIVCIREVEYQCNHRYCRQVRNSLLPKAILCNVAAIS